MLGQLDQTTSISLLSACCMYAQLIYIWSRVRNVQDTRLLKEKELLFEIKEHGSDLYPGKCE